MLSLEKSLSLPVTLQNFWLASLLIWVPLAARFALYRMKTFLQWLMGARFGDQSVSPSEHKVTSQRAALLLAAHLGIVHTSMGLP
jgi:hypothetical protein